jgi:hypothetical protein
MADPYAAISSPVTSDKSDPYDAISSPVPQRQKVGMLESLGRGAVEGLTFGFDDKLGMDKDRREQSRKDNPWTHFAGEMVGGLAPVVATGGAGALVKGGTSIGAKVAQTALRPLALAETTSLGGAAAQGAKIGASYGGLSGAGHSDDGDMLSGAAQGALTGAMVGPVVGAAAHGVGRVAQGVLGARAAAQAETADASAGSLRTLGRAFERDRIEPSDVMGQIRQELPRDSSQSSKLKLDQDQVEGLVRRHLAGDSISDIASDIGIGTGSATRYLAELNAKSAGPLNLTDRAGLVRSGSGQNTQMTLRAAAASPGEAQGIAREALIERQLGATGRMQDAFSRIVGSPEFESVAAKHSDRLQQAGDQAYKAAAAQEKPFDLNPIFEGWRQRYNGQVGPVPEAVQSAIDSMHAKVPVRNQVNGAIVTHDMRAPQNLEQFMSARQNLSAAIEANRATPSVQRNLIQMRNELSDEVRRTNPAWGEANDIWRDGKAAESAMEAGSRMTTRLNSQSRESMGEFIQARRAEAKATAALKAATKAGDQTAMTKAQAAIDAGQSQQELFRVGLARSLSDMMSNTNATNDLTRQLRLPGARAMIKTVLGDDAAAQLYKVVDAEHGMHRTYSSQFGSQTTPLKEAIDDINWAPKMQAWSDFLHPGKVLGMASDYAASKYNAARNAELMPMMTDTNPIKQLDLMRALQGVTKARQFGDSAVRNPAIQSAAPIASAAVASQSPAARRIPTNPLYTR